MTEVIPKKQAELKELRAKHGKKEVGKITVDQCIGGMRSMMGLFYDASLLDAQTGITFRDYTIPDIQK
jgi:citrate synthase